MRHVWKVRDNLTLAEWAVVLGPIHAFNRSRSYSSQKASHRSSLASPLIDHVEH